MQIVVRFLGMALGLILWSPQARAQYGEHPCTTVRDGLLHLFEWDRAETDWSNGAYVFHRGQAPDFVVDSSLAPNIRLRPEGILEFRLAFDRDFRSEVRACPHGEEAREAVGTEVWLGWRYRFGETYSPDPGSPMGIFQVHPGVPVGPYGSPVLFLALQPGTGDLVMEIGGERPGPAGLVEVPLRIPQLGPVVSPRAGDTLDIVFHYRWGRDAEGFLRLWLNGKLAIDYVGSTVYRAPNHFGSVPKFGLYNAYWNPASKEEFRVEQELTRTAGITEQVLQMGPLRYIKRFPGDPNYLVDEYERVRPGDHPTDRLLGPGPR